VPVAKPLAGWAGGLCSLAGMAVAAKRNQRLNCTLRRLAAACARNFSIILNKLFEVTGGCPPIQSRSAPLPARGDSTSRNFACKVPGFSVERRWSSRRFPYGYLVTTSSQLPATP